MRNWWYLLRFHIFNLSMEVKSQSCQWFDKNDSEEHSFTHSGTHNNFNQSLNWQNQLIGSACLQIHNMTVFVLDSIIHIKMCLCKLTFFLHTSTLTGSITYIWLSSKTHHLSFQFVIIFLLFSITTISKESNKKKNFLHSSELMYFRRWSHWDWYKSSNFE